MTYSMNTIILFWQTGQPFELPKTSLSFRIKTFQGLIVSPAAMASTQAEMAAGLFPPKSLNLASKNNNRATVRHTKAPISHHSTC